MGDPRSLRKKYSGPGHPWQSARMEEEKVLKSAYGLVTKKELWKANSKLKAFANQAKMLIALRTPQAELESKQLLGRLSRLGVLAPDSKLNDVLGLSVGNLLDRRLQTLVFKKGLAHSSKQARQYIVHGHILIGGKKMSSPGHFVPLADEANISFVSSSTLANPEHPERTMKAKPPVEPREEQKDKFSRGRPKQRQKRAGKPAPKNAKPAAVKKAPAEGKK